MPLLVPRPRLRHLFLSPTSPNMAISDTLSRPIYDRKYSPLRRLSWAWRILATYTSFLTWWVAALSIMELGSLGRVRGEAHRAGGERSWLHARALRRCGPLRGSAGWR